MNSELREKLVNIKRICKKVAARDTAYKPLEHLWSAQDPLAEHCGAVAYVVNRLLGGEIMSGMDDSGTRWIWNKVNGIEVSLTAHDLLPCGPGKRLPARKTANPRFALFYSRFLLAG